MKKHNEEQCLKSLSKAKCGINQHSKHIEVQKDKIGIKRWGMIDFLVNHAGWVVTYKKSATTAVTTTYDDTPKGKTKVSHKDNYKWN